MEGSEGASADRPSKLADHAPQISQWLREEPAPSAVEILRRARLAGYRGGKSALYELVRRVKARQPPDPPVAIQQVIVVSRDREHLYKFFQRAFVGNETVRVLMDRRAAERRKIARAQENEHRRGERRSPPEDGLLRVIGWTIVRLDAVNRRRGAPVRPGPSH